MNISGLPSSLFTSSINSSDNSLVWSSTTPETPSAAADAEYVPSEQAPLELTGLYGVEAGIPITLTNIRDFAQQQMERFQEQFDQMLQVNGIDTSIPITLDHEYGTGRIIVTSDHPDADRIEALLENNSELGNTYTGASSSFTFLRAAQEAIQFKEAYSNNPRQAVAQYGYLFHSRWDVSTTFTEGQFELNYQRVYQ